MIPFDPDDQGALALARSAMARADEALRVAGEARESARDGARAVYRELANLTTELGKVAGGLGTLQLMVSKLVGEGSVPPPPLPPMRERAPSHLELEQVAETAASRAAEKTASHHLPLPSQRVRAIVEAERNKAVVSLLVKIAFVLLPLVAGLLLGHLGWK
jgi:hypothetical protein